MPRKKAPVFVVGSGRSGTTLLYHMLLSSGGFAVYRTESNVFNYLVPRFGDLSVKRNKQRLMKAWLHSKLFWRSGLDAKQIEAKILAECKNGGDFLRIVMEEIARSQRVDRWADCTPEHLLYLPEIKRTLPDALVIHIIRDGRDFALSVDKQHVLRPLPWNKKQSLMVAGLYWEWIVTKGRKYGRMMAPDYMEVYFEELVTQPRQTLAKLGRFIDHDLDYDRILQAGIGSVREPNTSFKADNPGAFNPVGRWKTGFSREQLEVFEGLVGESLREFRYPLATSDGDLGNSLKLKRMQATYRLYYDSKLWLKKNTSLGKLLVAKDLSWL